MSASVRELMRMEESPTVHTIVCACFYRVSHVYRKQKFVSSADMEQMHGDQPEGSKSLDKEEKITVCHNSNKRLHGNCWWTERKQCEEMRLSLAKPSGQEAQFTLPPLLSSKPCVCREGKVMPLWRSRHQKETHNPNTSAFDDMQITAYKTPPCMRVVIIYFLSLMDPHYESLVLVCVIRAQQHGSETDKELLSGVSCPAWSAV